MKVKISYEGGYYYLTFKKDGKKSYIKENWVVVRFCLRDEIEAWAKANGIEAR